MVPAFGSVVSDVSHGFPVGSPVEIVATGLAVEPAAARAATAFLSDAERQRASRLAFDRDRRRFVVARARLRQTLTAGRQGTSPVGKPDAGARRRAVKPASRRPAVARAARE